MPNNMKTTINSSPLTSGFHFSTTTDLLLIPQESLSVLTVVGVPLGVIIGIAIVVVLVVLCVFVVKKCRCSSPSKSESNFHLDNYQMESQDQGKQFVFIFECARISYLKIECSKLNNISCCSQETLDLLSWSNISLLFYI